jgi:hypothetical protein
VPLPVLPYFAGYSGAAVLQPGFQSAASCGVQACKKLGVVEITAHGLRHSAATILLNLVEKYAIVKIRFLSGVFPDLLSSKKSRELR